MAKKNTGKSKFIELLIKKREQKGLLKKEVAELFDWTPMYYGRYENGNLIPSEYNIILFSKFLEISQEELLEIIAEESNKLNTK